MPSSHLIGMLKVTLVWLSSSLVAERRAPAETLAVSRTALPMRENDPLIFAIRTRAQRVVRDNSFGAFAGDWSEALELRTG